MKKDIIVSAGHKNFHMLFTAAEMERRERLANIICGAYPTAFEQKLLSIWPFKASRKLNRFINRKEKLPLGRVSQSRCSEILSSLSNPLGKLAFDREGINVKAFKIYGKKSEKVVRKAYEKGARIYHYRAGFGQSSVQVAKDLGMKTICDHSIVHPSLLKPLIDLKGSYPQNKPERATGIWGAVLDDIEAADLIVVNSDFVSETFEFMNFDTSKIHVAYLGVEDKFINSLPENRQHYSKDSSRKVRFLFAGGIVPRKGLDEITSALLQIKNKNLELHLAGSLAEESRQHYSALLSDERVKYHGMLSQKELIELMSYSDIFLFPSRAEGSARVIFEAMAAGCAIICTSNAGSIVKDDIGGKIIPVNNKEKLIEAINDALRNPHKYAEYGKSNKTLIFNNYRQKNYGDRLEEIYHLAYCNSSIEDK